MRIHLELKPELFAQPQPVAGPSSSPLIQIGGDLVLIELQGELSWEGDKSDAVVGVLGLDRPDKPTLHLGEHHLLHGKMANLQKPYAVIRRVLGKRKAGDEPHGDGDEAEHEEDEDEDGFDAEMGGEESSRMRKYGRPTAKSPRPSGGASEDEEDDPPLFPPSSPPHTPGHAGHMLSSSSPFIPPSSIKDYSSELDPSSPARGGPSVHDSDEDEGDIFADEKAQAEEARKRAKIEKKRLERRLARPERTRSYEVVGVVRKKVVFNLRPEPIVTATVLPP